MVDDFRDSVDTTKLTEAMATHTRPIQSQDGQNSSMKMLSGNKVPLLSRKLLAAGRGSSVLFVTVVFPME